jgi:hypothetical protein
MARRRSPVRRGPVRRGPVQGGRCSEPVGQHWPPVHHRGTICRERLAPHRKPMREKEVIDSPIATRYEYQTRAQGGMVAVKIPGSTTLRPASRAVHHRRALLARVRGQAQAQDFSSASGPRRGGCAPRRGAPGGAGRTHKPRMTGVRQHAKTRGCCSSAPAPHDGGGPEDELNEKFYSMQAPRRRGHASRTGGPVCAHRAGTHRRQARCATCAYRKTPIRATGSNGLNTHQPAASAWRV